LEDLPDYQQLQEQPQEQQGQGQDHQQHQHQLQQQFQQGRLPLFGQGQDGTLRRSQLTLQQLPGQQQQQQAPFIAHRTGAAQLAAEIQNMQRQRHLSGAAAGATAAAAAPGGES
jgi:hypothetical protein